MFLLHFEISISFLINTFCLFQLFMLEPSKGESVYDQEHYLSIADVRSVYSLFIIIIMCTRM